MRNSHAALNGTERLWGNFPEPAEENNCRCWAAEVKKSKKNCAELMEELRIAQLRLDGLDRDLTRAIEKHNASLKKWQEAEQKYQETLGKYALDVALSPQKNPHSE